MKNVLSLVACGILGSLTGPGGLVVAPSAVIAQEGKEIDLRPKFRKGQETRYTLKMDTTSEQRTGEDSAKQTTTQEIDLTLRVKDVGQDGGATVEMVYDALKLKSDSPLSAWEFDSKSPPSKDGDVGALLRPVVGLTLTMQTDATGAITSVSTPPGGAVSGDTLGQFTGADMVKSMFGPITGIARGDGTASVGATWVNESVMTAALGAMRMRNTYTLRAHRGNTADLDISGTVSLDGGSQGLFTIREGSTKGNAAWDTEAGILASMDMTLRTIVDTKLSGDLGGTTTNETKISVRRK
ncbi:MAG TPA: DUF6263 family protein [Phycisphaerales bacterium]|nr:DUF6263 family protein [Phycisphaerales bacterium]